MMLIMMDNSSVNQLGAQGLQRIRENLVVQEFGMLTEVEKPDSELIILDLNADGECQRLCDPESFVEELMCLGLLKNITAIHLIISDVLPKAPILPFAAQLAAACLKALSREIPITVPSGLSSGMVLVCPPATDDAWRIYHIATPNLKSASFFANPNYAQLEKVQDKDLIWEGKDILAYQKAHPDRIITSKVDLSAKLGSFRQ